ncbi:hypothetical protein EDF59_11653 [Novosphingobium sp. ST904]|nr:hypothetical protein EDF59_11653 [Novosphingobium sp. ST904]
MRPSPHSPHRVEARVLILGCRSIGSGIRSAPAARIAAKSTPNRQTRFKFESTAPSPQTDTPKFALRSPYSAMIASPHPNPLQVSFLRSHGEPCKSADFCGFPVHRARNHRLTGHRGRICASDRLCGTPSVIKAVSDNHLCRIELPGHRAVFARSDYSPKEERLSSSSIRRIDASYSSMSGEEESSPETSAGSETLSPGA